MSQKILKGSAAQERRTLSNKLKHDQKKLPQISVVSAIQAPPGNEPVENVSAYFNKKDFLKAFDKEFEDVQPSSRSMSARSNRSR